MPITYVGAASTSQNNLATHSLTLPTWEPGDFMLVCVEVDYFLSGHSWSSSLPPTGWNRVQGEAGGGGFTPLYIFWRFMQSGDSSTFSVTFAAAEYGITAAMCFRGVDVYSPWDTPPAVNKGPFSYSAPSSGIKHGVETVTPNTMAVAFILTSASKPTATWSGSWTETVDISVAGSGDALTAGYRPVATAGPAHNWQTDVTWSTGAHVPWWFVGVLREQSANPGNIIRMIPVMEVASGSGTFNEYVYNSGGAWAESATGVNTSSAMAEAGIGGWTTNVNDRGLGGVTSSGVKNRFVNMTNTPTDFDRMLTLNARWSAAVFGTYVDDTGYIQCNLYKGDGATILTSAALAMHSFTGGAWSSAGGNQGAPGNDKVGGGFSLNATALAMTKSEWDAAMLLVTWSNSNSMANDGATIILIDIQLEGTYRQVPLPGKTIQHTLPAINRAANW